MMKTLQAATPKWAVGTTLYVYLTNVWYRYIITNSDNTSYAPRILYWGVLTDMATGLTYSNVQFDESGLVQNGATTTAPTVPVPTTNPITAMMNAMMPMLMMFMMMAMIMPMMKGISAGG